MNKVRTRYAPSPTGYFHIGGARTALFNYLYAKHYNGEFIVRIEDTGTDRNVEGGAESQLNNLKWLNIFPDESILNPTENGPYRQSEKFDVYKEKAYSLLKNKLAYRCFCTSEELQLARDKALERGETPKYSRKCYHLSDDEINKKLSENKSFAIRLLIPENKNYEWHDLIRGDMSVPSSAMTDPIILKSNQIATYNFAVVIDDHDMKITHVFRGEEHISNTPYQIAIKEALGYKDQFVYAHLSIIVDESGKKLSKRNFELDQFIENFKDKGYLPEAIVNFIALLGWSDDKNQEILSLSELIQKFSIEKVSSAPAFFDLKKLRWISNIYFKNMDETSYISFIKPYIEITNPLISDKAKEITLLLKPQVVCGSEIKNLIAENFPYPLAWQNVNNNLKAVIKSNLNASKILELLRKQLKELQNFDELSIKNLIKEIGSEIGVSGKNLFLPIRVALTNQEHGPELAKIISIYGLNKTTEIITKFLNQMGN